MERGSFLSYCLISMPIRRLHSGGYIIKSQLYLLATENQVEISKGHQPFAPTHRWRSCYYWDGAFTVLVLRTLG